MFANRQADEGRAVVLTVTNSGTALLEIQDVELLDDAPASFGVRLSRDGEVLRALAAPIVVEPVEEVQLQVVYRGDAFGADNATLRLITNDPDEVHVDIDLVTVDAAPRLTAAPVETELRGVVPGASGSAEITVTNARDHDARIIAARLDGAPALVLEASLGSTLAAGASETVVVGFHPTDDRIAAARLEIVYDYPPSEVQYVATADLVGNGTFPRDFECLQPAAAGVVMADPDGQLVDDPLGPRSMLTVAPGTRVRLDGRASYDPHGGPVARLWRAARVPPDFSNDLTNRDQAVAEVTLWQPGSYAFALYVSGNGIAARSCEPAMIEIEVAR